MGKRLMENSDTIAIEQLIEHLKALKKEVYWLIFEHNQYVKVYDSILHVEKNATVGTVNFFSTKPAAESISKWYLQWCLVALRRLYDNPKKDDPLSLPKFLEKLKLIDIQIIKNNFENFEYSKDFSKEMSQTLLESVWNEQIPEGSFSNQIEADIELCNQFNKGIVKLFVDKRIAHADKDHKEKLDGKQLYYKDLKNWILRSKELCNRYEALLTNSSIVWPKICEFSQ